MIAARQTWALLIALMVVLAADAAVRLWPEHLPQEIWLPVVQPDDALAIEIRGHERQTRLVREGDGWAVDGLGYPADAQRVRALLKRLGGGVALKTPVDAGDHARYGLDGADRVVVEVTGAEGPLLRLIVGHDAPGGATWVRLPDRDEVYLARIGGREALTRSPGEWRDRSVLSVPPGEIVAIRAAGAHLVRDRAPDDRDGTGHGAWRLADDPTVAVDQELIDALTRMLGGLTAQEVLASDHPAGLDRPVAVVEVELRDGTVHSLTLGRTADGAYARSAPGAPIHRIAPQLVDLLASGPAAWRDRTLLAVDGIVRMTLIEGDEARVAELDRRTRTWALVEPRGLDGDPRAMAATAAALSRLRADRLLEGVSAADAGLPGPARVVLVDERGGEHLVEVGGPVDGAGQVHVRVGDRIGAVSGQTWRALRRAWLR